jgi:hypothetical protein
MPTSHYFPLNYGGFKGEQNLVQDLADEQIKLFGTDVYYLPRKLYKDDQLNDVIYSEFSQKLVIEMLMQNIEGFGNSELVSKFGLKVTDEINFMVSRRRWEEESVRLKDVDNIVRPLEGDLIFFPLTKDLYEIKFVEVEAAFHQLGKLYFYKITAEIYEMGNENIDTGIAEIDLIEEILTPGIDLVMVDGSGTDNFSKGEIVTGGTSGTTATVSKWDAPTRTLTLITRDGTFVEGETITGSDSGAVWTTETFSTLEDPNSEYDNNKYIEQGADEILDFTEKNPFGEYGNYTGSI